MTNKIIFFVLFFMFIYVTTFNIFLTGLFRVPAPMVFLAPLLLFYRNRTVRFQYSYQLLLFFIAAMLYMLIAQEEIASFFAFLINLCCVVLFFNYILAHNKQRLIGAIAVFYCLLFFSGIIMLIDHRINITQFRAILSAGNILQSPSGISDTIFSFGYQMAALTSFILACTIMFKSNWFVNITLLLVAICFIFFGMQRSVLVAFSVSGFLLLLFYYKSKSILFFLAIVGLLFVGQGYVGQFSEDKNQLNILSKNVKNSSRGEMRGSLMSENIKVISNYPFGLLFYNKSWNDVVKHNYVYKSGPHVITSHNAYLMFITYLGPVLAISLLILLYHRLSQIIWHSLKYIHLRENIILASLSCSFISVSVNSFFHNEWLLAGNGPTLFLYFCILQLYSANKAFR